MYLYSYFFNIQAILFLKCVFNIVISDNFVSIINMVCDHYLF